VVPAVPAVVPVVVVVVMPVVVALMVVPPVVPRPVPSADFRQLVRSQRLQLLPGLGQFPCVPCPH
jgi:hypothetical protein